VVDSKGIERGLDILLELDGEKFLMDNGYWSKFEVKLVVPNNKIPHGIRYSLTLHDKNNKRLLGYDNAHGIKPGNKKFGAKKTEWDHKHEKDKVKSYEFESASQLLEDFWNDVNNIMSDS
jgi:hypothetical protein